MTPPKDRMNAEAGLPVGNCISYKALPKKNTIIRMVVPYMM